MYKKILSILTNSLLITIFVFIFIYSNIVKEIIIYGINIWLYNLIPSLFPFLLISKLLIYYKIFILFNKLFGKSVTKLFNVSENASYIIIISIFTGFPTGSIYIKDLLNNKLISIEEANKLITFTSFANPLFVISFIGEGLLNNKKLGFFILIIHIITGLLIGIFYKRTCFNQKTIINNTNNKEKFSNILIKSINESFVVLVNMLGIIIFFLIINSIIKLMLPNNFISILLNGLIEITTGTVALSKTKLNSRIIASFIGAYISFNGLSVHFQVKSIIDDTNIKYNNFLIARIIHSLLCFVIIFLLYNIIL